MIKDRFNHFNSGRVNFFLLAVITVILFAAVLNLTSSVILPFTIAVFLAFVTIPIVRFLEKFHIPRIASALFVLIFIFGSLFAMAVIFYTSAQTLLTLYPRYEERIREIYILLAQLFELPYDEYLSIYDNIWGQVNVRVRVRNMTLAFTNGFIVFVTDSLMVSIFMIFLMFEAVFIREKLDEAFAGTRAERIKKVSSDVITQVTNYLSIMFLISLLNGVLAGLALWLIGLEFAAIWGIIQFILNFIPNVGSIAAGIGATIFAIVQFWPAPGPIAATALVMLGVNILCGFIIYPKVMGDRLGLSPLVILVSLMVWGWLWGFAGLILSVPMMAIIKIVCANISVLEPIAVLMSSRKAIMAMKLESEKEAEREAAEREAAAAAGASTVIDEYIDS